MESELKQVLCVTTPETTINYRWEKDGSIIDEKNVCIVDLETIKRMEAQGITFERDCPTITEGMVFGLHPYKQNSYIDLALPESRVLEYKVNLLMQFCKNLGVTSMAFEASLSTEEEREWKVGVGVTHKAIPAEVGYRSEERRKEMQRYQRYETYSGKFTEKDYEKAKELYKCIGYDSDLEYFLTQREPQGNKIRSLKKKNELTSEMNSLTEAAFKLTAMGGLLGVSAQFKKKCSVKRVILLEMELNFSA